MHGLALRGGGHPSSLLLDAASAREQGMPMLSCQSLQMVAIHSHAYTSRCRLGNPWFLTVQL